MTRKEEIMRLPDDFGSPNLIKMPDNKEKALEAIGKLIRSHINATNFAEELSDEILSLPELKAYYKSLFEQEVKHE